MAVVIICSDFGVKRTVKNKRHSFADVASLDILIVHRLNGDFLLVFILFFLSVPVKVGMGTSLHSFVCIQAVEICFCFPGGQVEISGAVTHLHQEASLWKGEDGSGEGVRRRVFCAT